VCTLTGQLADKPTHGQSSRELHNSQTGRLADNKFLENMAFRHVLTIHYLYVKPNPNSNPIEY